MASTKIYKVRSWVVKKTPYGDEFQEELEEIYVGRKNFQSAKDRYTQLLKNPELIEDYGLELHVELFEPYILADGKLADYPESNIYIEQYVTNKG